MIEFTQITVSNFKGFGKKPTSLMLDRGCTTLILGNNEDIGSHGSSKNGVGKTTILEAIVFCLYGKGLDKAKTDEMINFKNGKKTVVTLDFLVNGKKCQIIRGRKPNILELTVDGQSLTRDSMKNTDSEISSLIGISYDVFLSTFFLNPFKESFMNLSPVGQKNHIEQILSLDVLAERAETLKAMKKDMAVDIKLKQKDVDNAITVNNHLTESLNKLYQKEKEFEEERAREIKELSDALESTKEIDFNKCIKILDKADTKERDTKAFIDFYDSQKEMALHELDKLYLILDEVKGAKIDADAWDHKQSQKKDKIRKEIEDLPSIEDIKRRDEINARLSALIQELFNAENGVNNLHKEHNEIGEKESRLEKEYETLDSGKCPYCEQRHTDETRLNEIAVEVAHLHDQKDKLDVTIKKQEDKVEKLKKEQEELRLIFPDIDSSITVDTIKNKEENIVYLDEFDNEYRKRFHQLTQNHGSIAEIEECIRVKQEEYNEIANSADHSRESLNRRLEEVKEMKEEVKRILGTDEIDEIRLLEKEIDIVKDDLTKAKNRKNHFTDQIEEAHKPQDISYLEDELNELIEKERHIGYLIKLLTDPKSFIRKNIVDQFLPYLNKQILKYTTQLGLPHVAEVKNDMTVEIEYMNKDVSYATMSRGEKLRLDAATAMAFRDLVGVLGLSTNLMLVDEYVDSSLDDSGVEMIMSLLEQKCPNLFLISHKAQFIDMIEDVITVTKRNGFSFID